MCVNAEDRDLAEKWQDADTSCGASQMTGFSAAPIAMAQREWQISAMAYEPPIAAAHRATLAAQRNSVSFGTLFGGACRRGGRM